MKKIAMSIIFVSMTLIAAAQSSVTVSIYNGPGVTCCPMVTSLQLYVISGCTTGWHTVPVPPCGTPITYNASTWGGTDIIAAKVFIIGATPPPFIIIGDNTPPPPCGIAPFSPAAGGGGGATGVCQWEATWQYITSPTAVLTIRT